MAFLCLCGYTVFPFSSTCSSRSFCSCWCIWFRSDFAVLCIHTALRGPILIAFFILSTSQSSAFFNLLEAIVTLTVSLSLAFFCCLLPASLFDPFSLLVSLRLLSWSCFLPEYLGTSYCLSLSRPTTLPECSEELLLVALRLRR